MRMELHDRAGQPSFRYPDEFEMVGRTAVKVSDQPELISFLATQYKKPATVRVFSSSSSSLSISYGVNQIRVVSKKSKAQFPKVMKSSSLGRFSFHNFYLQTSLQNQWHFPESLDK